MERVRRLGWPRDEISGPDVRLLPARHHPGGESLYRCILSSIAGPLCFFLAFGSSAPCVAEGTAQTAVTQPAPALAETMRQAAVLLRKGEFLAAIEAYQKVLKISPHDEQATLGLAAAYRGVFNYEETRRLLQDAAQRYPTSALALVESGKLDIHLQHYDQAIEHLTRARATGGRLSSQGRRRKGATAVQRSHPFEP